jgi:hypothetical protein
VAGVGRSFGTLPLSVPVALLPPREQAYENRSSITLISFGIGHCWDPKNNIFYHPEIGCVGTAVLANAPNVHLDETDAAGFCNQVDNIFESLHCEVILANGRDRPRCSLDR